MKIKQFFIPFMFFLVITSAFFYKTLFYKYVPFPGDLLVSEYNPWKSDSFLGYNPGSYPNKAQYFDTLRQIYPWKTFVINSLKNSSFPLWNPYNFSGAPLLANFQSAVFYPLNFLYFLFPQIIAWSILVTFQPFLALLFTYTYVRKIGISRLGSYFAAISFAFSSFMTVWLEYNTIGHVILWFPLILLSLEKLFEKRRIVWSLILVASISFALFAGHIQIFAYLFIFIIFYSFIRIWTLNNIHSKKNLAFFLTALLTLPLGIGAIQLVPGIELIMQSARSAHAYDFIIHKILLQFWQLVMLFVPDFFGNPATRNYWIPDTYVGDVLYIGLIPLFFVVFAFFNKKVFFVKFFILTTVILFILITLNPITALIYKINIPIISGSASNLLVFIICFSMSVLCGFGVDAFLKNKYPLPKYLKFLIPLILVFSILWLTVLVLPKLHWFSWENNLSISLRNLLYSTIIFAIAVILFFVAFVNKRTKYFIVICLLFISLFDLWRYFQKFNPFSPGEFTYPKTSVFEFIKKNSDINRYWGYASAAIEANFSTQYSLFAVDGYDPLYPKRYGEFIQAARNGKVITEFTDQTRSDAFIINGYGEKDLRENNYRLKVLDFLGVKYFIDRQENGSTQKTFPIDRFSLIYEKGGWKIFENKKALSRIFLASNYKVVKSKEEFEKIFFGKDFDPLKTIILEDDLRGQRFDDSNHRSSVQTVSYTPNEVRLKTTADGKRLLFLSDTYFPGWKAFIDGKETKIFRADYAFRAVIIPQGNHAIEFLYDPLSFKVGYVVSLASIILLIVSLLTIKKKLYDI